MREVIWEDLQGYKHKSLIPDDKPDEEAVRGLKIDPPNLDFLDWDGAKRDLHNALFDGGLFTWHDVQLAPRGMVETAILTAMRARLVALYKGEARPPPGVVAAHVEVEDE